MIYQSSYPVWKENRRSPLNYLSPPSYPLPLVEFTLGHSSPRWVWEEGTLLYLVTRQFMMILGLNNKDHDSSFIEIILKRVKSFVFKGGYHLLFAMGVLSSFVATLQRKIQDLPLTWRTEWNLKLLIGNSIIIF